MRCRVGVIAGDAGGVFSEPVKNFLQEAFCDRIKNTGGFNHGKKKEEPDHTGETGAVHKAHRNLRDSNSQRPGGSAVQSFRLSLLDIYGSG